MLQVHLRMQSAFLFQWEEECTPLQISGVENKIKMIKLVLKTKKARNAKMILQLSHARMILQASCFEGISLKSTGSCRPKSDGYLLMGQIFAYGHKAEKPA